MLQELQLVSRDAFGERFRELIISTQRTGGAPVGLYAELSCDIASVCRTAFSKKRDGNTSVPSVADRPGLRKPTIPASAAKALLLNSFLSYVESIQPNFTAIRDRIRFAPKISAAFYS